MAAVRDTDPAFMPLSHRERRRGERRTGQDRRRSEGRYSGAERRISTRRRLERRDSAAGHLRNALQMLITMVGTHQVTGEARDTVVSVIRRIWSALGEMERPHH